MIVKIKNPDGTLHVFWLGHGRAFHIYKKWPNGQSKIFDSVGFPWSGREFENKQEKQHVE